MTSYSGPLHIAYAEDHTIVRKGIISLLQADPDIIVTVEAADGRQLLERLKSAVPLPDICLVDIHMPQMDGFECIAGIKQQWPGMKILVLTALTEDIYLWKMLKAGANGFLLKGCDVAEIKNALLTIRRSGKYYSGAFNQHTANALEDKRLTLPVLTDKEMSVLRLSMSDMSFPEIAQELKISIRSVQGVRDNLFKKLEAHNRASLVVKAIKMGFLIV